MAGADSIRKVVQGTQTVYVHDLPDQTKVYFSEAGRQDSTVSRFGHTTSFTYDSGGRLWKIMLPAPAGVGRQEYVIGWPAAGTVGSYTVTSPPQDTVSRITKVAVTALTGGGGRVRYIQDPDSPADTLLSIRFRYPDAGSRLVSSRTDKRETRNSYGYTAAGNRFATLVADTGASRLNLRTTFSPVEVRGLKMGTGTAPKGSAVPLTDAMTEIFSPRGDSISTRIWTNGWGAPTAIRDALGAETKLFREDARFPARVTEVRAPNGFTTRAVFDAHGAPLRTTEINPYGDGQDAVTTYEYGSTHPFLPTKVIQPEGDFIQMEYLANGNTAWAQDGRGSPSRVSFSYRTGECAGLPATVSEPAVETLPAATTTYTYDLRCNPKEVITSLGDTTSTVRNNTGRISSLSLPIDATGRKEVQSFVYDRMDRVRQTTRSGPAMGLTVSITTETAGEMVYNGAETLTVENRYDRGGYPVAVRVGGEKRDSTVYDALGRPTRRFSYDPRYAQRLLENRFYADSLYKGITTTYDAAGNPASVLYGDGPAVTMTYDKLDRLVQQIAPAATFPQTTWCYATCNHSSSWPKMQAKFPAFQPPASTALTIPADTTRFTYDPVTGAMRRAINRYSRIGRDYYPNGALRGDTLMAQGATSLTYSLRNVYDRNGRRTALYLNGAAVPQQYQYDPQTGALAKVVDPQGNLYTYAWTGRNDLKSLTYPGDASGKLTVSYSYDQNGRLKGRSASGGKGAVNSRLALSLTYDRRGKMLSVVEGGASSSFLYSGLGYLMYSGRPYAEKESFVVSPDGNIVASRAVDLKGEEKAWTFTGPGRRMGTTPPHPLESLPCWTPECVLATPAGKYDWAEAWLERERRDAAGNETEVITRGYSRRWLSDATASSHYSTDGSGYILTNDPSSASRAMSWYAADQKLRFMQSVDASDYRWTNSFVAGCTWCWDQRPVVVDGELVEYRYDALGRRIYMDTQRTDPTVCWTACFNTKEFFVWDGDQLLFEKRTYEASPPTTMTVQYVHGLGVDQPLGLIQTIGTGTPSLVFPHRDARGQTFMATNLSGNVCCTDAWFPGDKKQSAWYSGVGLPAAGIRTFAWYGSLVAGSTDSNGLMYMRNRYYNPESGQFTQIDPIGIAGGLNVYGYAAGDPVNFSDPFGLCPEYAGGDGLTETADDCPSGVLENWATEHVILDSTRGATWEGVDSTIRDAVIKASIQLNATFLVTATTNGVHAPNSHHYNGRAVDIGLVNGVSPRILDVNDPMPRQVSDAVRSFIPRNRQGEFIGPNFAFRMHRDQWSLSTQADLMKGHRGHIHSALAP
jgi:RHS repeat-associated protein